MTYNGGWQNFADSTITRTFFRASDRATKSVTIASGQVLKAKSFLQTDTTGKSIAHPGIVEVATVTMPTKIDAAETQIIAGLTFTAGGAEVGQAELVAVWSDLPAGTTYTQANALNPSTYGSFTAGTLTGYSSEGSNAAGAGVSTSIVRFISTTPNAGVTNLAVTGTGDAATVVITDVPTFVPPSGVLMYDVDASGGDVVAEAWIQASFWADALVWSVNPSTDTITLNDGTTKGCTNYNTGCLTNLTKQKFVDGSEFRELGFLSAGETA